MMRFGEHSIVHNFSRTKCC